MKIVPKGSIANKSLLVQEACCLAGDEPSTELMLTKISDAFLQMVLDCWNKK